MNSADQKGLPVMSRVRVHNFSVSLDSFSAGAHQSQEAPFGHAGDRLVRWFMGTRSFHVTTGQEGGSTGIDDAFASNWGPGIGVEIMGRNKFGPQRGPWADEQWKGWGGRPLRRNAADFSAAASASRSWSPLSEGAPRTPDAAWMAHRRPTA